MFFTYHNYLKCISKSCTLFGKLLEDPEVIEGGGRGAAGGRPSWQPANSKTGGRHVAQQRSGSDRLPRVLQHLWEEIWFADELKIVAYITKGKENLVQKIMVPHTTRQWESLFIPSWWHPEKTGG